MKISKKRVFVLSVIVWIAAVALKPEIISAKEAKFDPALYPSYYTENNEEMVCNEAQKACYSLRLLPGGQMEIQGEVFQTGRKYHYGIFINNENTNENSDNTKPVSSDKKFHETINMSNYPDGNYFIIISVQYEEKFAGGQRLNNLMGNGISFTKSKGELFFDNDEYLSLLEKMEELYELDLGPVSRYSNSDGSLFETDKEIAELARKVLANSKNNYEAIKKVYYWLAGNICYDLDFPYKATRSNQEVEDGPLRLQRATRQEFAVLAMKMLRAQGIPCVILGGNMHNAAYADGRWVMFNASLASIHVYDEGQYLKDENQKVQEDHFDYGLLEVLGYNEISYVDAYPRKDSMETKLPIITLISQKDRSIFLWWNKVDKASGYEIQYSTKKDFSNSNLVKIEKQTDKYILKNLKKNTKYYIKIRAYKIDKWEEIIYSKYSKAVSVKIK